MPTQALRLVLNAHHPCHTVLLVTQAQSVLSAQELTTSMLDPHAQLACLDVLLAPRDQFVTHVIQAGLC
jgi:hypothetical protein